MTQQTTVLSYLFKGFQDDLDLQALVNAYNTTTQGYLDWFNTINLPIYTGLSGAMLDWIGAGVYGFPRPSLGIPAGAIYNVPAYNQATYDAGTIGQLLVNDDYYKRILTWKLHRGDGFYVNINWLKRRLKRFLIGVNGTSPIIDSTYEISVSITTANTINIIINYPSDPTSVTMLIQYVQSGVLDLPFQYTVSIASA